MIHSGNILCDLGQIYVLVLVLRAVFSFFPLSPGSPLASVYSFIFTITEPVLAPLRRVIPPLSFGGMGIDMSFLVVFFAFQLIVLPALCRI